MPTTQPRTLHAFVTPTKVVRKKPGPNWGEARLPNKKQKDCMMGTGEKRGDILTSLIRA